MVTGDYCRSPKLGKSATGKSGLKSLRYTPKPQLPQNSIPYVLIKNIRLINLLNALQGQNNVDNPGG